MYFGGVVAFEEGALAGDDGVIAGVGAVEAVVGEELDVVEDFSGGFFVDAVFGAISRGKYRGA